MVYLYQPSYMSSHRVLLTESEERELFEEFSRTKSRKVMERIVRAYTPIVFKYAKSLRGYENISQEELRDEGVMAIIAAANRFDLSRGLRFATYCRTWVQGLMLAYITKNYFHINACSNQRMKRLFFNLRRIINREMKEKGQSEPSREFLQSIASKLEVSIEEVISMYTLFRNPTESLSDPVRGDDDDYTKESLIASTEAGPETLAIHRERTKVQKAAIARAMATLTERERVIFQFQVLSEDDEQKTLQMLANRFGLSKERIRQIRNKAQEKIDRCVLMEFAPQKVIEIIRSMD